MTKGTGFPLKMVPFKAGHNKQYQNTHDIEGKHDEPDAL